MSRPTHLYVFAYDVSSDRIRAKVADRLEQTLVRVQFSVFEGRLESAQAARLAREIGHMIGPDDCMRVYCVTEAGRRASLAVGGPPLPEAQGFFLL